MYVIPPIYFRLHHLYLYMAFEEKKCLLESLCKNALTTPNYVQAMTNWHVTLAWIKGQGDRYFISPKKTYSLMIYLPTFQYVIQD